MPAATSLTTTGTRPTGRKLWDSVSEPNPRGIRLSYSFYLGKLLEKNLRRSLAWKKSQREVATLMSAAFDTATVNKWREIRDAFDLNDSEPNPYEEVDNRTYFFRDASVLIDGFIDVTMAQLKLELLKEEAKELSEGPLPQKVLAGAFLRKAIEIEDRW